MNITVRMLKWLSKAAVFFALFAFALNNQHPATLHLAFGHQWQAPMALIILLAFVVGLATGIVGMLPGRWRRHRHTTPREPEADHGA